MTAKHPLAQWWEANAPGEWTMVGEDGKPMTVEAAKRLLRWRKKMPSLWSRVAKSEPECVLGHRKVGDND